jgi:hypothetical protein
MWKLSSGESRTVHQGCIQEKTVNTGTRKQPAFIHKAMPVTGHGGPEGCEMLKLPHFLRSDGDEVVSLMHQPPFTPQEDSWGTHHFC